MLTLVLTLLIISIIQFSIYLILEFTNMRNRNNKLTKKLNEHDKLNTNCRDIHNNSDNSGQGNETE